MSFLKLAWNNAINLITWGYNLENNASQDGNVFILLTINPLPSKQIGFNDVFCSLQKPAVAHPFLVCELFTLMFGIHVVLNLYFSNVFYSGAGPSDNKQVKQELITDGAPVKKKRERFKGTTEEEVLTRKLPDHLDYGLDIVIVSFPFL